MNGTTAAPTARGTLIAIAAADHGNGFFFYSADSDTRAFHSSIAFFSASVGFLLMASLNQCNQGDMLAPASSISLLLPGVDFFGNTGRTS